MTGRHITSYLIEKIRELKRAGDLTVLQIAEKVDVSESTVKRHTTDIPVTASHWARSKGKTIVDNAETQQDKTEYIKRLLNRDVPVAEIRRRIDADPRYNQTPNATTIDKIKNDPNFVLSVRGQGRTGTGMDEKTLLSYVTDDVKKKYRDGDITFRQMQQSSHNSREWLETVKAIDAYLSGDYTPEQEKLAKKRFEYNETRAAKTALDRQLKNQAGQSLPAQYHSLTTRNQLTHMLALRKSREFRGSEGVSNDDALKMGRDWVKSLPEDELNRLSSQLAKSIEYSEGKVLDQLRSEFPEMADVIAFHHWRGFAEGGGEKSVTAVPQSFHRWWHGDRGPLGKPDRSRHDILNRRLEAMGVEDYTPYRLRTNPSGDPITGTPPFLRLALERAGLGSEADKLYDITTQPASPELLEQVQRSSRHPSIDASATALEQIRKAGMQEPPQSIFSPGSKAYQSLSILDAPDEIKKKRFGTDVRTRLGLGAPSAYATGGTGRYLFRLPPLPPIWSR
jgi:hypothetical protein